MNIFIYGDSNAWGYMPNIYGYQKDAPVFRYLDSQIWWSALTIEHNVMVNALCGRAIANENPWLKGRNSLLTVDKDFENAKDVDIVIVALGTNDCKSSYENTAEDITRNLELLTRRIERLTKAQIVLISPPRIVDGNIITDKYYVGGAEKSQLLDEMYKELALKNGFTFISGLDLEVGEDGEHLTPEGHTTLRRRVLKAFEQIKEKE